MGWILLHIALLFSFHITAAYEKDQNKKISNTEHSSLGSFLKDVLDSSQELTNIYDEVKAIGEDDNEITDNEDVDGAIRQNYLDNNEYTLQRQKRKAKPKPAPKIAPKDPNTLRRVLNFHMKRAQMFRHGRRQTLKEHPQEQLFESKIEKREFVTTSEKNLKKDGVKLAQECGPNNTQCERKKSRIRRWKCKSRNCQRTKAHNSNLCKPSSVVTNKLSTLNEEEAAENDIQSNVMSDAQNVASYEENTLPINSIISKQSDNSRAPVDSPASVVPGSAYDLDCVHELPSLEGSLFSKHFKGPSSLTDDFSNENDAVSANDIELNEEEARSARSSDLNDELPLDKIANKQVNPAEVSRHTSFRSDRPYSRESFGIVHPIVLEVLDKVSKANNKEYSYSGKIGGDRLASDKTVLHGSSSRKFTGHKSTFSKNKYESKTKSSPERTKVSSLGSLNQNSQENDMTKKESLKSKTVQASAQNNLLKTENDFSSKTGHKKEVAPVSNTKEKTSQVQKSKLSELPSVQKAPHSVNKPIYKPTGPIIKPVQKHLTHSGESKVSPMPMYSKNYASFPKRKLDSKVPVKAEPLQSSNTQKASINQAKTRLKTVRIRLLPKTSSNRPQRNAEEETAKGTEKEKKVDTNKQNSKELKCNSTKQGKKLAVSEVERENIESSDMLTSESNDQTDAEEAGPEDDNEDNHKLMDINKRSLEINEGEQQEELLSSSDAQNVEPEEESLADQQSKFDESIKRKRFALRLRMHKRKGMQHSRHERDTKLKPAEKYNIKDFYFSPQHMAKHRDSENAEDNNHQNMLKQVEDMILGLKEKDHKDSSEYGSGSSQRIGRRLQFVIGEVHYSDDNSDNDDYYYYDEADVDKRRPEHTKVSQNLNTKENIDKLDTMGMTKNQMYVQKDFGGTEHVNNENPKIIDYSNNNDPSFNPIQNKQVFSDLIIGESNKIPPFDKEVAVELLEAHSSHSVAQNGTGNNNEKKIMDNNNNPQSTSLRTTNGTNKNSNLDKNSSRYPVRKNITEPKNEQTTGLNESLEELNNFLNDTALNETATYWNDTGEGEMDYNAQMRYNRTADALEVNPSLKRAADFSIKEDHRGEKTTRIEQTDLDKIMTLGESGKESSNLNNAFNLGKEKRYKATALQASMSSINSPSVMSNASGTLHETTSLDYEKWDHNSHNDYNKPIGGIAKSNRKKEKKKKKKLSKTKSAMQIPISSSNEKTDTSIDEQTEEFEISRPRNVTSKIEKSLQHLPNYELSTDVKSRGNFNDDMSHMDTISLGSISGQNEGENKEADDNSPRYSYEKEEIQLKGKAIDGIEEKVVNHGIPGNDSLEKITEYENSKSLLEMANTKANGKMVKYESVTEKQNFPEILHDKLQSLENMTKDEEETPQSSDIMLRHKRDDEDYSDEAPDEDYTDYYSANNTNSKINNKPSTIDNETIVPFSLDDIESTKESILSNTTNTNEDTTQHNDTVNNSMYVTSPITTMASSPPTSPKPDQSENKKQSAEKISVDFQPFNVPTNNSDNSQLNNTINGALANQVVDLAFGAVNVSQSVKHIFGTTLKKQDHGSQEKQPSYETGISLEMLEKEEEQYHAKTGSLLAKVMELLDVLVEAEVNKRSCIVLQSELHEHLLWLLDIPEPGKPASSEFSVPDNFLFLMRNKYPRNKTEEYDIAKEPVPVRNKNVNLKKLNRQIGLLKELIGEYTLLPDSEKSKVNYVYSFLREQLHSLEGIRRSHLTRLNYYKADDDNSNDNMVSKIILQGARKFDARLNNAENARSKLRYNGKWHTALNEAPFKHPKPVTPIKEDESYSKMTPEHEGYPSSVSEVERISEKYLPETSSDQSSSYTWSKGRQHSMEDMTLEPEYADSPVHSFVRQRKPIVSHQRQRRYGTHGHGGSRNKHRNVTQSYIPTDQYKKLVKKAAEFRERRKSNF